MSFCLKGQIVSQSFVDFEEAIAYRNILVKPKIKKTRDRKAYMAIYNQNYKKKPKIPTVNPPSKGVYQAGPATVSICEFSTEKPAGKFVSPEDKRRTKGGWSERPIIASGPVVVSWT